MATTKELIEQINQIFRENKMEAFVDFLADEVVWEMHSSSSGHTTLKGKEAIGNMDGGENMPVHMNFEFRTVIIEGNQASVECTSSGTTPNGKSYKGTSCDIYHFKNDKVVKMTSYVIDKVE
ncbi:MAG: nuclear transport factor 2 family protein [Pedobacter sp.]|nr:MAG: nuclear transport factor 2 family protein [Pedobacter sp.]